MTILSWMWYATLTGAVLAMAAWIGEAARSGGRRWMWALAIAGTVVGPFAGPVIRQPAAALGAPSDVGSLANSTQLVPHAPWPSNAFVAGAWLGSSALLLVVLFIAHAGIHRDARRWRSAVIEGNATLLSSDVGPAVLGFVSPRIVLPNWALSLGPDDLHALLLHEQEHVRAHDQQLVLGALVALVLTPWNATLWFQFARLRAAIELDCDRRVTTRGVDAGRYARLLMMASLRPRSSPALSLALLRPSSAMLRRVRFLVGQETSARNSHRRRLVVASGCVALAGILPPPPGLSAAFASAVTSRAGTPREESPAPEPARAAADTAEFSVRHSTSAAVAVRPRTRAIGPTPHVSLTGMTKPETAPPPTDALRAVRVSTPRVMAEPTLMVGARRSAGTLQRVPRIPLDSVVSGRPEPPRR